MIREYIIKISDEIMEKEIADRPQELVRCKDCKHYEAQGQYCRYDSIWGSNKRHPYGIGCDPDWFCADGE